MLAGITIYLSLVHLMAGPGSPTELHGRRTSFIQGVLTVPPNDIILAGATIQKHSSLIVSNKGQHR